MKNIFWSVLLVAFVFCKLAAVTAIAHWSWAWVLFPLWFPVVLGIGIFIIAFLVGIIVAVIKASSSNYSSKLAF